jgi:hypothetical protein
VRSVLKCYVLLKKVFVFWCAYNEYFLSLLMVCIYMACAFGETFRQSMVFYTLDVRAPLFFSLSQVLDILDVRALLY